MHKNKKKTKIRSVFIPLLFLYILALPVLIKSTAVCASAKTRAPGTVKILSVKNKNTKVAGAVLLCGKKSQSGMGLAA